MTPLRILFVKESQHWPRGSGHDVHGFHLMRALAARGHRVSLATVVRPTPPAIAGLPLEGYLPLGDGPPGRLPLTPWQRRLADYYPFKDEWGMALAAVLRERRFDAVVLVARHLLPLLSVVRGPVRVCSAVSQASMSS